MQFTPVTLAHTFTPYPTDAPACSSQSSSSGGSRGGQTGSSTGRGGQTGSSGQTSGQSGSSTGRGGQSGSSGQTGGQRSSGQSGSGGQSGGRTRSSGGRRRTNTGSCYPHVTNFGDVNLWAVNNGKGLFVCAALCDILAPQLAGIPAPSFHLFVEYYQSSKYECYY